MEELYIKKILKGDVSCYSWFINRYKDMAFTIASRITGNKEDAEEVVQDSFLKAYNALSGFREDASFSTWFFRIVVNTSLTRSKRKLSHIVTSELEEIKDHPTAGIEAAYTNLQRDEQKKIIGEVLKEMEMEDNLLMVLYYLNENSIEEIKVITGIPVENIKMKLHRARKKMYRLLDSKFKNEMQYLL